MARPKIDNGKKDGSYRFAGAPQFIAAR